MNNFGIKKFLIVVIIGVLVTAVALGLNNKRIEEVTDHLMEESTLWEDQDLNQVFLDNQDSFTQPDISWEPYKVEQQVKGIFMTGHSIGYTSRFIETIAMTNESVVNAWVIDVKDDHGTLTYLSTIPMVKEAKADQIVKVKDFHLAMEALRENQIYTIARIVTFKDKQVTSIRPDLAIKTVSGDVWRDRNGDAWLNPYNPDAWAYPIAIAKEAATKGFKEIQFDYVRFPTDGNRSIIDYGKDGETKSMEVAIADFLAYAREELRDYGVVVSADIFGLVTTVSDDMRLGQHLETLTTATDVLAPMVYPSHYALGTYGVAKPDFDPYHIVYTSMNTARERMEAVETSQPKAKLRPWLQNFTASYLELGYYQTYGKQQVEEQIQATYDAGINEWILWNAGNQYTWSALQSNE